MRPRLLAPPPCCALPPSAHAHPGHGAAPMALACQRHLRLPDGRVLAGLAIWLSRGE
jgi:hypothetical protein